MVPRPRIESSSDLRELLYERSREFRNVPPVCFPPQPGEKWLASSALQKSIRRGNREVAALAAETLLAIAPDYVWRRLPTVALEDVGYGNRLLSAVVIEASKSSVFRHKVGDRAVLHCLVDAMASSTKCRALTDLLMLDTGKPPRAHDWYRHLDRLKLPFLDDYLARYGFACAGLGRQVPALLGMMPDRGTVVTNAPDPFGDVLIHDLPACVYDKHTSQGKRAMGYFAKSCPDARQFFAHHPELDVQKALGITIFVLESAYLDRCLSWKGRDDLLAKSIRRDFTVYGLTKQTGEELIAIVKENRKALNRSRGRVTGA